MTTLSQSTKRKLSLLQLAEELGNVSKACKVMGYHRDTFYEVRRAFQVGGVAALVEDKRGPRHPHPNRIAPEIEQKILDYALAFPTHGAQRVSNELRLAGTEVGPGGVRARLRPTTSGGRSLMADSIVDGVPSIINDAFDLSKGTARYHHSRACLRLSGKEPKGFNALALVRRIYGQVEANWHQKKSRSSQNWRWTRNCDIDPKNTSPEVVLERWIARTAGADWANQVPIASGLTAKAGGRRAIDLVHRKGKGAYDFIEFKANENGGTPLFAAMEILQYGVIYLFSRQHAKQLANQSADPGLLSARSIHLKVLAPAPYYEPYDLAWLERRLNRGLEEFTRESRCGVRMDFRFESLSVIPVGSRVSWKGQLGPR